jgi:hypothetical protein
MFTLRNYMNFCIFKTHIENLIAYSSVYVQCSVKTKYMLEKYTGLCLRSAKSSGMLSECPSVRHNCRL